MDPTQHPRPQGQASLVCVGGMLRVADIPNTNQSVTQSPRFSEPLVTPFKQLASPFTAAAPFTAPTTPYSSTPLRTPHPNSPTFTPYSLPHTLPLSSYRPHTPQQPIPQPNPQPTPQPVADLQPQPQFHLLSQKQVRELRRLCRKTANRAQFEGRLTQIRQVASIAAMATSTVHLFDPGNPHSGNALRVWVAKHRADGADWRDERPLSADAVAELRRWDLLLKSWARGHFENHPVDIRDLRHERVEHPDMLKPVRLEFEKISLAASPTPATPANAHKPRNVYSTDFLRLASPVTPADGGVHHLATPSPAAARGPDRGVTNANTNNGIRVAGTNSMTVGGSTEECQIRSAWSKAPLTGLTRRVDSRKPLTEVCINREGDHIRVSVPPTTGLEGRYTAMNDQENTIPADLRRAPMMHASTTAKSWRNALMSTDVPPQDDTNYLRTAAKTLFPGHDGLNEDATVRSTLDWGKLRRAGHDLEGSAWQGRHDNC